MEPEMIGSMHEQEKKVDEHLFNYIGYLLRQPTPPNTIHDEPLRMWCLEHVKQYEFKAGLEYSIMEKISAADKLFQYIKKGEVQK
jgi:hypothetical protein